MDIITGWQIYWLTRCDAIKAALDTNGGFLLFAVLGALCFGIFLIGCCVETDEISRLTENGSSEEKIQNEKVCLGICKVGRKIGLCFLFVFLFIWLFCRITCPFVPTTKEMAAVIVIPKVANSESVQGLGEGVVELAKSWMEELKPQNVKADAKAVGAAVRSVVGDKKDPVCPHRKDSVK